MFTVAGQRVPFRLLVEASGRQFQHRFAEEIVRVVLAVVPHRDLQRPFPQLGPPDSVVDERLIPPRVVRVRQRLRPPLRLLATFEITKSDLFSLIYICTFLFQRAREERGNNMKLNL